MSQRGNPNFTKGNQFGKLGGRPRKHEIIKALETADPVVWSYPDHLLDGLATANPVTLEQANIPRSQINQHVQILAAGFLYIRGLQSNASI